MESGTRVIPIKWTEGMSRLEVLIVLFAAHCSKDELVRLAAFFEEFSA